MKRNARKILSFVLALVVVVTTVFSNSAMQAFADSTERTTVAAWEYSAAPEGDMPFSATSGSGSLELVNGSYTGYSSNGLTASNLSEDSYWLMKLDGSSYTDMTFTASMRATKTAPGHFILQYSVDEGTNWTDIGSAVTLSKSLSVVFENMELPSTLDGKEFYLRLKVADGKTFGDNDFATSGNVNLNKVIVSGTEGNTKPSCQDVTASVDAGQVAYGTDVELSCETANAEIYYNTDGSDNYTKYESAISVTKDMTISAYAKAEGYKQTGFYSFAYTVSYGDKLTQVSDGDKIVIAFGSNILTSTASGKKLSALAGSVSDEKLSVTKTDDNKDLVDAIALLTVSVNENGQYTFTNGEGKYLTSNATGNGLSFADEASDYSLWTMAFQEDGTCLIGNVNASYTKNDVVNPQYLEYYKGFTTYNYISGTTSVTNYSFNIYTYPEITDTTAKSTETTETQTTETQTTETQTTETQTTETEATETEETEVVENKVAAKISGNLYDGDKLVIYYENGSSDGLVMSTTASGSKLAGVTAVPSEDKLTVPEGAAVFNVVIDENDYISFVTDDGKYLTSGATGSSLTLADAASDYSLWTVEQKDAGYYIVSVNAKYSTSNQYMEYYKGFTTYSYKSASDAIYLYDFYALKRGTATVKCDSSMTIDVAQWAGNANYEEAEVATTICGDKYATNDMLDTTAEFSAVVSGDNVVPYSKATSTTTGSTSYYMSAAGIGSGSNDYMQFAFSTKGYGNLSMGFRLRASNTAAGALQLQYSTDGTNFANFTTGSYSYAYTAYSSDGTSSNVSKEGEITDGIAKTSYAPTYYITFQFDLPSAAANADKLYVRLVPSGTEAAKSGKTIAKGGVLRIDSVVVTGNPVVSDSICGYVKSATASGEVALGSELTLSSSTKDATIYYSLNGGEYTAYDDSAKPVLTELPVKVTAYAVKEGLSNSIETSYQYTQAQCASVKGTPNGGAVASNSKVTLKCSTEGATIMYALLEDDTTAASDIEWTEYKTPISLTSLPAKVQVKAVKDGYIDSAVSTLSFTQKTNEKYNIYFGQVHAHTNYSDGAGSCEEAFSYATKVDNLDFLAVTDHSNSLDNAANSKITENVDTSETDEWTQGHELAKKYTTDDFTCIYGYEMTWSNGLGHINTFNTEGFQSRTQTEYATYSTALQNYYAALNTVPDSISQFNHPGTTFGDFNDFAYYSEANDALITMIEVGNGEGTVGSSGYFPSYEYYTRALDKGWHVAPTNNQDNHKGKWGDANTARTVVLADTNDEEAIYDAMRNYRIYATEDNNLSIYYTLDSYIMGTVLEQDQVGDTVELKVELSDADTTDTVGKVEVIANGGISVASTTVSSNEDTVTFEVPSSYSYYYIKVTEGDGDIAVTAPVWVGDVEACGINKTYTNTALAVQGESLDVNTDLYNNESEALEINNISVTLTDNEGNVTEIANMTGEEAGITSVASNSTATFKLDHTYASAGDVTYTVTVDATLNGVAKTYSDKLSVSYVAPSMVTNVIVDGTHYNDYVTGYYGGNVTSFVDICADNNIKATIEKEEITAEDLEDCALLILSAPAKKSGTANAGDYQVSHYSDEFIQMVADYVAAGGSVIVCGLADYSDTTNGQTATEQNKLLAAIGSTIKMGSDEVYDETNNGGQAYRMYPTNFNTESDYLSGVVTGQTYSQYSGCSVDVSNATESDAVYAAESLVMGFDTTYSINCKDESGNSAGNTANDNKGNVTFLAHQSTKAGGNIFVAGGVFMSDFEVDAEIDNNDSLPYANYNIITNILNEVKVSVPTSTIAQARAGAMGDVFAVEGYVTSGTSNEYNTFFDTIYIQDETGGIDIFPYAQSGLEIGTKVRVVGFVSEYQGDKELKVISTEILSDERYVWDAKELSTKDAMDYDTYGGSLLKTSGKVTRVEMASDGTTVSEFWIADSTGSEAAIFIDGYIYSGTTGKNELSSFVKVGQTVSATGVLYMHPEGDSDVSVPVFRVRNCDDISLEEKEEVELPLVTKANGKTYYVDDNGKVIKGPKTVLLADGNYYFVWYDGSIIKDKLQKLVNTCDPLVENGIYLIDENGVIDVSYNGIREVDGKLYYFESGRVIKAKGVVEQDGKYYYIWYYGYALTDQTLAKISMTNGLIPAGQYAIDENGVIDVTYSGLKEINDKLYYFKDGYVRRGVGLYAEDGYFYYINWYGYAETNATIHVGYVSESASFAMTDGTFSSRVKYNIDSTGRIMDSEGNYITYSK